jgi:hypothetical protein
MVEYSRGKNLKILSQISIILVFIAALFFIAHFSGFTREYCGTDTNCFSEKTKNCGSAEVYVSRETNLYYYKTTPSLSKNCNLKIEFKQAQEGALPEHTKLLEGKSMKCKVPKEELKTLDVVELSNIIPYCSGPLKESLYELIIKRMYETIIVNLGDIAEKSQILMNI